MRGRSAFLDPTDVQGAGFEADLIYQPERRNRTRLRSSCTLSSLPPFFLDIRHAILASSAMRANAKIDRIPASPPRATTAAGRRPAKCRDATNGAQRHFPPPWSVEETDACYIVRDANG
jgi:hypothetical protein